MNYRSFAGLAGLSLFFLSYAALATMPLQGQWQIMSYQIIGYPAFSEAEADVWLGRTLSFTEHSAQLSAGNNALETCDELTAEQTTVDAEGLFLIGYEVKPARLGVTSEYVEQITVNCQHDSWLQPEHTFILLSETQMLSNWQGVFFFLQKRSEPRLPITPQSVGMIMPKTAFTYDALTHALPHYTVQQESRSQTVEQVFYSVYQGTEKVLDIFPRLNPNAIDQIHIYSPQVLAPGATHPGQSYTELAQTSTPLTCQTLPNQQVACHFAQMEAVRYVFEEVPAAATAAPAVANAALTAERLQQAILSKIIWQAQPDLVTESQQLRPQGMVPESSELPELNETGLATPQTAAQVTVAVLPLEQRSTAELEVLYQQTDLQLNQVYRTLRKQLTQHFNTTEKTHTAFEVGNLITIQGDWIRFRDHNCNWQSALTYSEAHSTTLLPCLIRMTEERIEQLTRVLQHVK